MALSSLLSTKGSGDGFGENGSFGLKLHRTLPGNAAIAIGANNLAKYGNQNDALDTSFYIAASKAIEIGDADQALVLNVGLGNQEFDDPGENGVAVFGSATYFINKRVSLIADHTGRFTNAAISFTPFVTQPFVITTGFVNLGNRLNVGHQFASSISYVFSY